MRAARRRPPPGRTGRPTRKELSLPGGRALFRHRGRRAVRHRRPAKKRNPAPSPSLPSPSRLGASRCTIRIGGLSDDDVDELLSASSATNHFPSCSKRISARTSWPPDAPPSSTGSVATILPFLQGAPAPATSEFFRQTNDFFYLCGVEVPHAYLLLDGRARTTASVPTSP